MKSDAYLRVHSAAIRTTEMLSRCVVCAADLVWPSVHIWDISLAFMHQSAQENRAFFKNQVVLSDCSCTARSRTTKISQRSPTMALFVFSTMVKNQQIGRCASVLAIKRRRLRLCLRFWLIVVCSFFIRCRMYHTKFFTFDRLTTSGRQYLHFYRHWRHNIRRLVVMRSNSNASNIFFYCILQKN